MKEPPGHARNSPNSAKRRAAPRPSTGAFSPINIRPSCTLTRRKAIVATKSNFIPPGTICCDRRPNAFHLQRLKPKLGNRSNASSEAEFHSAWARLIGEEGRGIATILEMVHHTRFDCVMASAALMRRALVEAVHHCRHRRVFGRLLIDQPLMRNVLADLALESEAATLLTIRLLDGVIAALDS